MLISDLEFNKKDILNVKQSIENICLTCKGISVLCKQCPVDSAISSVFSLKANDPDNLGPLLKNEFELLTEKPEITFSELIFDKNKVFISQDSLESLCENCQGAGILCEMCQVHQMRRDLASLPVIDIEMKFPSKKEKKSGGGCGSSCSTSCGTKKK
jgi:hypothetical protein